MWLKIKEIIVIGDKFYYMWCGLWDWSLLFFGG